MTVLEKHRIIRKRWICGVCENCGHNPKEVKMVQEHLVSGDPEQSRKSKEKMWVCPRCGFSRKH